MVYIFLADGFEECEALVPLDILRRGGINVKTVGIGSSTITGAHGISVICDITEDEAVTTCLEGIILPGGMPGTVNLEASKTVQKFIDFVFLKNLLLGAICAAPSILGHKGLLVNKKATCYPGYEKDLTGACFIDEKVVKDGTVITSCGAGAAFDFGFELLAYLKGDINLVGKLKASIKYTK